MTEPSYSPRRHGPTLLYYFQSYVQEGATPQAAAARLTDEIKTGKIEVRPALPPEWRLQPSAKPRRPRLSRSHPLYGLSVIVNGTRTDAGNFYGRPCSTLPPPPPPYVPPKPTAEPIVSLEILQQLAAAMSAQLVSEKPSPPAARAVAVAAPKKSKLEEKLGRPVMVQLRAGEHEAWLEIVPHLKTLYDADKLPNESAARREVAVWLRTDTKKRTMARSTIHVGVKWHCVGWWD
jgi:hypothetical protein